MTIGEAWTGTNEVAQYVDGSGVDLAFEFQTAWTVLSSVRDRRPASLATQMANVVKRFPTSQFGLFLTNHDMDRVANEMHGDPQKERLAAAVYLTMPGVPFMYYGEEIGMTGGGRDEDKRTPMQWTDEANGGFSSGSPWEAVHEDGLWVNVNSEQADSTSLWRYYQNLIHLRRSHPALLHGSYVPIPSDDDSLLCYARIADGERLLIIHNFSRAHTARPHISLVPVAANGNSLSVTPIFLAREAGGSTIHDHRDLVRWQLPFELPAGGTTVLTIAEQHSKNSTHGN